MSQHDMTIADANGADFLADLNDAMGAIASSHSGATEPSTQYPYQIWADTANDVLKVRNEANSAWLTLAEVAEFVQSGTGAATRTLRAKCREVVSVTDYTGADSTGATASTTAFRNAAASAGYGAVIVPPGTWLLDDYCSYSCEFWFMPGATLTAGSGKYITGASVDLADRDYECMMGMGYFNIWLEGTTFSSPASNTHVATLWRAQYDGTAGTFSVDQAGGPLSVGAYNGIRWNQTVAGAGSTYRQLEFRVEDGSTYNNGKATLSFLVQCETGTVSCTAEVEQFFGTGGSPSAAVVAETYSFSATTTWRRHAITFDMPSTSSKTFGSDINDCLKIALQFPATGTFNVAFQEVKLERGPIRTPFSALPLSLQHGYIDRYLQYHVVSIGDKADTAGEYSYSPLTFRTEMRAAPTITFSGGSHANCATTLTATGVQKYGATAYISSAAGGAYYDINSLAKYDARI